MSHLNTVNRQPSTVNQPPVNQFAIYASEDQKTELLESPVFGSRQLLFAESLEELVRMKADAYFDLLYEDEQDGWSNNKPGIPTHPDSPHWQETDEENDNRRGMAMRLISPHGQVADEKNIDKKGNATHPGSPHMNTAEEGYNSKARIASLSKLLPAPVFINSVIQPVSHIHPGFIRINGWPGFLKMPLVEAAAADPDAGKKAVQIFGDQVRLVKDIPGLVTPRIISMIIHEAHITLAAGVSTREEIDTAMKLGAGYPLGPFEWEERIGVERVGRIVNST